MPVNDTFELHNFLIGFGKIPHFVEVFFYSENKIELDFLREIKQKSDRKIEIGKSKKVH